MKLSSISAVTIQRAIRKQKAVKEFQTLKSQQQKSKQGLEGF